MISNTENSLAEVTLAISIAEEIHEIFLARTDFTFTIQREVMLINHLQIAPASFASTEFMNISSTINQSIDELARLLNYQAALLRKMADLLQSLLRKSSALAVVEDSLQRVEV